MTTKIIAGPKDQARAAIDDLATKWGLTSAQTERIVLRLIRVLGLRLREPYFENPGHSWAPSRIKIGQWAWVGGGWRKAFLRPALPPPKRRADFLSAKADFQTATPLTFTRVVRHLLGDKGVVLGQQPRATSRLVVIDLDAKQNGGPVKRRYSRVVDALGLRGQHAVVRSSASGGLHIYFRVAENQGAPEPRHQVAHQLSTAGIKIENGYCEVFPKGSSNLRVPFGEQSRLLRRGTLRSYRAPHLDQVLRFLKQIRRSAVALRVVTTHGVSAPSRSLIRRSPILGASSGGPNLGEPRCAENEPSIEEIMRGITGPGRRNKESFRLLQFFVGKGWDDVRIHAAFTHWLDHGDHHSKDFERDASAAKRKLLADLPGTLRRIRSFRGTTKTRASSTPYLSLSPYRSLVCTRAEEEGVSSRAYLARYQSPKDERLVANEPAWLRPKLLHLISILRFAHQLNGVLHIDLRSAEVSSISGRQRLAEHQLDRRRVSRTKTHVRARAPYRVMLDAAIRQKVISKVKSGVCGAHGDIYKLNPAITEPKMSDESTLVHVPSWKQHEMRVRHVTRYSTSPVWQHAKTPSFEELARGLGGLLADARLSKRQKSKGGPSER
ncbi:MAG: hypothetical protein Q8N23_28240 [Archangium sp.]|nr:hypothetical protein [Archangium sp.]MDP3576305.1 hypothetical protein [Archangium sp.]